MASFLGIRFTIFLTALSLLSAPTTAAARIFPERIAGSVPWRQTDGTPDRNRIETSPRDGPSPVAL